jgi:hypothetical protein
MDSIRQSADGVHLSLFSSQKEKFKISFLSAFNSENKNFLVLA